jgi:hypothetical protein
MRSAAQIGHSLRTGTCSIDINIKHGNEKSEAKLNEKLKTKLNKKLEAK